MAGPFWKDRWAAIKAGFKFGGNPTTFGAGYGDWNYWSSRPAATDYAVQVRDPLDNSIVAATIGWIGRTFPEAPIRVMVEVGTGDEPVVGHPLTLLMRRPNPFYSGSLVWTALMMSWVLDGNAYLVKERSNGGDVLNLWYVPHWTITPRWKTPYDYVSYYQYTVDGTPQQLGVDDVIHLRNGLDPANTRKGLSQLKSALREIYTDNQITEYESWMLTNRGTPGAVISPKDPGQILTQEQAAFVAQDYFEKTTGAKRGRPIVSLGAIDVQHPSFSPADMDLHTMRMTPEERISALIGIPAIVVGLGAGLSRSTYNNTEQAYEAAYLNFLIPVQRMIADELTTQLLPDFSHDPRERVAFDYRNVGALSEDADELAARAEKLFASGIIDRAMAITMIGEEPQPADKGIYYLPRGGSFSDGSIAEPIAPQTMRADTEPGVAIPQAANGHRQAPIPA